MHYKHNATYFQAWLEFPHDSIFRFFGLKSCVTRTWSRIMSHLLFIRCVSSISHLVWRHEKARQTIRCEVISLKCKKSDSSNIKFWINTHQFYRAVCSCRDALALKPISVAIFCLVYIFKWSVKHNVNDEEKSFNVYKNSAATSARCLMELRMKPKDLCKRM